MNDKINLQAGNKDIIIKLKDTRLGSDSSQLLISIKEKEDSYFEIPLVEINIDEFLDTINLKVYNETQKVTFSHIIYSDEAFKKINISHRLIEKDNYRYKHEVSICNNNGDRLTYIINSFNEILDENEIMLDIVLEYLFIKTYKTSYISHPLGETDINEELYNQAKARVAYTTKNFGEPYLNFLANSIYQNKKDTYSLYICDFCGNGLPEKYGYCKACKEQ